MMGDEEDLPLKREATKRVSVRNVDWETLDIPSSEGERAPLTETAARLAVTVSLGVARTLLHAPTDKLYSKAAESDMLPEKLKEKVMEAAEMNLDFAGVADKLISASTKAMKERGFSKPEYEMTGEAFAILLRLATQLTGDMAHVSSGQIYDATKSYMYVQHFADRVDGNGKAVNPSKRLLPSTKSAKTPPLEEMRRYCRFAMAAYGTLAVKFLGIMPRADHKVWSNKNLIEYLTGINPKDNLLTCKWRANWVGSLYKPGHYLLLDHEHKEVILAVRGSYRFQDAITDLMCEDTEFSFHYEKAQDLDNASKELANLFSSLSGAIAGMQENMDDMTLGELQENMKETTGTIYDQLQDWVAKQAQLLQEEMRKSEEEAKQALKELQGEDDDDEFNEEEDSGGNKTTYITRDKSKAAQIDEQYGYINPKDVPEGHRHVKGRCHFGFLKAAQVLASELEPLVVDTMKKYPSYKLVVVGHSLGAAVASLITLMWTRIDELKSVRCFCFAAPSVFSKEISESPIAVSRITSVILADDIVPRLSLASVSDLRNAVTYCATTKVKNGDKKDRTITNLVNDGVKAGVPDEEMHKICKPIMEAIRKEELIHAKLHPPGTIWHIPDLFGSISDARRRRCTEFGEIGLVPGMFHAHLPQRYAYACCPYLPNSEVDACAALASEKKTSLRKSLSKRASRLFKKK